ncbi:MAG: hypothetical protein LH645_01255 [Actinomycetia bacterium]|nr:hypothetical protein [Actinomycetes bacterium]
MTTVNLHIGTFKTGTSYLQSVLVHSQSQLADVGVLWPGGAWADQVAATKGLMTSRPGKRQAWDKLMAEVDAWSGGSAIISMETLSMASPSAVRRAASSLRDHRVRVILTARDLGRVIPAQWQESVQNGKSWSYETYLDGVVNGSEGDRAYDHFWNKHDWAGILRTWSAVADDAELVLVTVPPSGAPRGLLWERFCAGVSLDSTAYDATTSVNESLGAASAEVLRYVSAALEDRDTHRQTSRVLKKTLAKGVLNGRKSAEPTLVLPHHLQEWAVERSRTLIADLAAVETTTIGTLEDLEPRFAGRADSETENPSSLPVEDLLATAGFGLAALCNIMAENGLAPRGYGPDDSTPRRVARREKRQ